MKCDVKITRKLDVKTEINVNLQVQEFREWLVQRNLVWHLQKIIELLYITSTS